MNIDEFKIAYDVNRHNYERLKHASTGIAEHALKNAAIQHLPILSRVKDRESACKKLIEKSYSLPFSEMTDLVGLRIVVFLVSEIEKCVDEISKAFKIDKSLSVDKRFELKPNEFGYQSVHIICSLGESRSKLEEYRDICAQPFEIQIRSALQHTWAEIEHKRGYKGPHALPIDLQRRLNAASAALELVDREFSEISRLTDHYISEVKKDSKSIATDPLSTIALKELLFEAVKLEQNQYREVTNENSQMIMDEFKRFGVTNISDIRKLLRTSVSQELLKSRVDYGTLSLNTYRSIMLFNDAEKYLKTAKSDSLTIIRKMVYDEFLDIVGTREIDALLEEANMTISDD